MYECFYYTLGYLLVSSATQSFVGTMEDTYTWQWTLKCINVKCIPLPHIAALLNAECMSDNVCFCPRVWSVRYNHSHDQLVLTASSDSRLILSNMVSISSEPFGHLVDDEELSEGEDNHQEDK